jgi:hypothetical protein
MSDLKHVFTEILFRTAWNWFAVITSPSQIVLIPSDDDSYDLVMSQFKSHGIKFDQKGELLSDVPRLNLPMYMMGNQGITGRAMRTCLSNACAPNVALKVSSIPSSIVDLNKKIEMEASDFSYSANYEVLMLQLCNTLIYNNKCPHFVQFFGTFVKTAQATIPPIGYLENRNEMSEELTIEAKNIMQKWQMSATFDDFLSLAGLVHFHYPTDVRMACVFAALISNYFPNVMTPPMSKFYFALHMRYWLHTLEGMRPQEAMAQAVRNKSPDTASEYVTCQWVLPYWRDRRDELIASSRKITSVKMMFPGAGIVVARPRAYHLRYVFAEFVNGGTLEDLLTFSWMYLNNEIYRVILFQVMFSLYTLYKEFPGFRHNDMHTGNVLLNMRGKSAMVPLDRKNKKYVIKVKGKTVKQDKAPFIIEPDSSKTYRYEFGKYIVHVPDCGVFVKIWDFDLANLGTKNPLINKHVNNQKAANLNLTKKDTYYDIAFFLNCVFLGLNRSTKTSSPDVPFPADLKIFYMECMREALDADAISPVQDDLLSYRLNTSCHVPDKIDKVMKLGMDTIFSTFLKRPPITTKVIKTFCLD